MSCSFEILRDICVILWVFVTSLLVSCFKKLKSLCIPTYKDLNDDIILITGAGSGIGRLMCLEFAKYCPTLVGVDVNKDGLEETARALAEKGGPLLRTYTCDLRSRTAVVQTAERILREVGTVTVLVNNAGVVSGKRLLNLQPEDIENTFQVNVISHFYLIQAFLPGMIGTKVDDSGDHSEPHPRGHIVTVASIASLIPSPGLADYCASKAAALMMSDVLELELRDANLDQDIHITRICPFFLGTRMFEGCKTLLPWLFPIVDADYCARQIVKAVRTNARQVYIYQWHCVLAGLYRILPAHTIHRLFDLCGLNRFTDQLQNQRARRSPKTD